MRKTLLALLTFCAVPSVALAADDDKDSAKAPVVAAESASSTEAAKSVANAAEKAAESESAAESATSSSSESAAIEMTAEMTFADNLAKTFINDIFESKKSEQEKVDTFKKVFLNNCDIAFISKFVLGKAWKSATDEEKTEFTSVFSEAVVLTWAGRFKEYNGQMIRVLNSRSSKKDEVYVDSQVFDPKNPADKPIDLIWRIKDSNGSFKIVDLIIEGVSMVMTYRNEYNAVLQTKGGKIQGLTDTLAEKNDALAATLGVKMD